MKRWAILRSQALLVAALGLPSFAAAQIERAKIYSMPTPPPREVLERLNLRMAYRVYVPMDGRHDGLATVQLKGSDLFVQTRSGLVALIDADTGAIRWRQRVGRAYVAEHELAFNSREVYVVNNTHLYALDRLSGALNWSTPMEEGVAAPPVADENMLFVASQTGRLSAYFLPRPDLSLAANRTGAGTDSKNPAETPEERRQRIVGVKRDSASSSTTVSHLTGSARQAHTSEDNVGPRLLLSWSEHVNLRLELPMLLTYDRLVIPTPNGIVAALAKLPLTTGSPSQAYRFSTESPILAAGAYYDGVAYVGAEDANLYALETDNGRLRWRHTAGTAISRAPAATQEDVYIVAARNGMTRLDRITGEPRWRIPVRSGLSESNAAADRFLAANPKYVYAADFSGRLLVLDRRRGVTLSGLDTRDFVFPISNTITDRLYLAANNGLIVCLHDREYTRPVRHRQREEEAANPVRLRLAGRITDLGSADMALRDMLDTWAKRYPPLRFRLDDNAFQAAGRDVPIFDKVKMPKVNDRPLGGVLTDVLATVRCIFEVIGDTIVIFPAPAPAAP